MDTNDVIDVVKNHVVSLASSDLSNLQGLQTLISSDMSGIKSTLSGHSFSSLSTAQSAVSTIDNYMDDIVGDLTNSDIYNTINGVMTSCLGIDANNYIGLVKAMRNSYYDKIFDKMNEYTSDLPEVGVSKDINTVQKYLANQLNIPTRIDKLDKYLNCLDSVFSYDVSSMVSSVNTFLGNCNLDSVGSMDMSSIYSDISLGSESQAIMNLVHDKISEVVTATDTMINNTISNLYELTIKNMSVENVPDNTIYL